MLKIFTDVVQRRHYDANGNPFGDDMPQMFYGGTETVRWQLCRTSPDLDPETQTPENAWEKYTGLAGVGGIGAYLTADNNYTHKLQGVLSEDVSAGPLATVKAVIPGASRSVIDSEGVITLIDSSGGMEEVEYSARSIEGEAVTFTISDGTSIAGSYPAETSEMDVSEAVYMQAVMDTAESDPASGLFVFTIRAQSEKLRRAIVYSDTMSVAVRGLELAIFKVDPVNAAVEDVARHVVGTFAVMSGIADTSASPVVSVARQNAMLAYIQSVVASGVEHQYSVDGSADWHEAQAAGDLYFRYRNHLAAGAWSPPVRLPDPLSPYGLWLAQGNVGDIDDYFAAITGPRGEDVFLYRAWASDAQGTGFSLTPADNLPFIAEVKRSTAYSNPPTLSDFAAAGAVWVRWLGAKGEDGASTFTKVAWASDASGTGFSLTPADNLPYRAEIHLSEDIVSPTLSDFAAAGAVWVRALYAGFTMPDASTASKGVIQLATGEEAVAGENALKAVTPATLKPLVDAKEPTANKTQAIDAVTPSVDKYPSEAAVVDYVAGLIPDVPGDLSELTDTTGILAGKVDKVAGYGLSKNDYTDADAAKVAAAETEATLGIDTASGDTTKFLNQKKQWVVPAGGSGSGPTVELLSTLPAPGSGDVGRVALFTGASTGAYVQNKIYLVVMEDGPTYAWRPLLPPLTVFTNTTPTIYPGGKYTNRSPDSSLVIGSFTFNIGGYEGCYDDAEIIMDVPPSGVTVSAGPGLTLVDALTAGKRNFCVIKFFGTTARLFVVHTEDL